MAPQLLCTFSTPPEYRPLYLFCNTARSKPYPVCFSFASGLFPYLHHCLVTSIISWLSVVQRDVFYCKQAISFLTRKWKSHLVGRLDDFLFRLLKGTSEKKYTQAPAKAFMDSVSCCALVLSSREKTKQNKKKKQTNKNKQFVTINTIQARQAYFFPKKNK